VNKGGFTTADLSGDSQELDSVWGTEVTLIVDHYQAITTSPQPPELLLLSCTIVARGVIANGQGAVVTEMGEFEARGNTVAYRSSS